MFGKRKKGKMLAENRLDLEDSLKPFMDNINRLNLEYANKGLELSKAIEDGDNEKVEKLQKSQENLAKMIEKAYAQYNLVYDRIDQNSEVEKNDATKRGVDIGTAVSVGASVGSMALAALSLRQSIETDKKGLLVNKNVKRFFENIHAKLPGIKH
jgi:hypothetical protein